MKISSIIVSMKRLLAVALVITCISPASAENHLENVCLHSNALYHAKFNGDTAGLKENKYAYGTAGESYRADNSMALLKKYGQTFDPKELQILEDDKYKVFTTTATLVPEPKNKSDKFAVKVIIKGKHVSYIPKVVSYDVAYMMKQTKQKSISVKACISHYPGAWGPQVSLGIEENFLGEEFDQTYRMRIWYGLGDAGERGPGAKCTKYFSKFYCGPLEK